MLFTFGLLCKKKSTSLQKILSKIGCMEARLRNFLCVFEGFNGSSESLSLNILQGAIGA